LYKTSLRGLNLLFFVSVFILPGFILVTAYDIAYMASSIKIANPTQTMSGKITMSTVLTIRNTGLFDINLGITPSIRSNRGTYVGVTGSKLPIPPDSHVKSIPVAVEITRATTLMLAAMSLRSSS